MGAPLHRLGFVLLLLSPLLACAQAPGTELYRLVAQDLIEVSVFGEADVGAQRRVDAQGTLNLPLIGTVEVRNLTVAEAEALVRQRYIDAEIFIDPQISIAVIDYAPREVSVLGQVASPGKILLPPERGRMNIVEVITAAGGFTRIAKSDGVRVTRVSDDGEEEVQTIDVERMINGRRTETAFVVKPGDIVFVPERVF